MQTRSISVSQVLSKSFILVESTDPIHLIHEKLLRSTKYIVLYDQSEGVVHVQLHSRLKSLLDNSVTKTFKSTSEFVNQIIQFSFRAIIYDQNDLIELPLDQAFVAMKEGRIIGACISFESENYTFDSPLNRSSRRYNKVKGYSSRIPMRNSSDNDRSPDNSSKKRGEKESFFLNTYYPKEATIEELIEINVIVDSLIDNKSSGSLPIMAKSDIQIDLILNVLQGFDVIGQSIGSVFPDLSKETTSCIFKIRATSLGKGQVSIYALQQGQSLGSLNFSIDVKAIIEKKVIKKARVKATLPNKRSQVPDLGLMIMEERVPSGETQIRFYISAADTTLQIYLKPYGPVVLRTDPAAYFNDLFQDIEGLNLDVFDNKQVAIDKLERIGASLYEELIPNELKLLLWSIKDKIKTVKIDSTEPFIPWEICRMFITQDGTTTEAGFLCELFEMTRWIPGHGVPQPNFVLNRWAVVVPTDSDLPFALKEKMALQRLAGQKYSMESIEATYADLQKNLESGEFSLWHFTGHGSYQDTINPNKSAIILNNNEKFTPDYLTGKVTNMSKGKPLVFLNACQVGKSGMGLTGVGGWAPKFLSAGASAFIGAYWSIMDDGAYEFAETFYRLLIKEKYTIGKAALEARKKIKDNGDPTWLAYTIYADPMGKID